MPKDAISRTPSVAANVVDTPWQGLSRSDRFFENAAIRVFIDRASVYAAAGVPLHLTGPAGMGKTSFALRIAGELGRPVSFMSGNDWLTAQDFIGREIGRSESTMVDKYVQSVRRTETSTRLDWEDAILAVSMRKGYTLVYDEFTRASPQANSVLLPVIEEGVLVSTDRASRQTYIHAHPDFRIILTSNSSDYVGVNGAPDALVDRMVTLRLPQPSVDTLAGIASSRSGLDPATCARIVRLVAAHHAGVDPEKASSLRSVVLTARIAAARVIAGGLEDADLAAIAGDVLRGRGVAVSDGELEASLSLFAEHDR
ncbi:AAA family ATPase [Roseibacterium sp. SDUM158017]|uniref:AAA family ATPase n=1 Tax=Roseicyclus salinarum TaxID=3036773 RepID=UPI002414D182|nr:AAA family ATPase [Roseibacterium sp. SDUM158017]MDG4648426.1 AAA family ATPase [Roseibacterium sp. SDUM158017]